MAHATAHRAMVLAMVHHAKGLLAKVAVYLACEIFFNVADATDRHAMVHRAKVRHAMVIHARACSTVQAFGVLLATVQAVLEIAAMAQAALETAVSAAKEL
jgi:hypothetical protein